MAERREYRMTRRELEELELASRSATVAGLRYSTGGRLQRHQECWKALGEKYGFNWHTARPVPGKSRRCFIAEPLEEDDDGDGLEDNTEVC